jgi:predicted ABC-type ATPase
MRVFAGPNGSGKSTLKTVIRPKHLGVYVNADEIEAHIHRHGVIDIGAFGLPAPTKAFSEFLIQSPLLRKAGVHQLRTIGFKVDGAKVYINKDRVNAYIAAAVAAYFRQELLRARRSFTFETVMSSPDKIELMRDALAAGYRVYLYYIATADPEINVSRVKNRVRSGGHDVPNSKITSRYVRSLELLYDAIKSSSRAYLFDNSTDDVERVWIAEVTDGLDLELRVDQVPAWFAEYVLDKVKSR